MAWTWNFSVFGIVFILEHILCIGIERLGPGTNTKDKFNIQIIINVCFPCLFSNKMRHIDAYPQIVIFTGKVAGCFPIV